MTYKVLETLPKGNTRLNKLPAPLVFYTGEFGGINSVTVIPRPSTETVILGGLVSDVTGRLAVIEEILEEMLSVRVIQYVFNDYNTLFNLPSINGITLQENRVLTPNDVQLGNVQNIAPANMPVSAATQEVLDDKVNKLPGARLILGTEVTKLVGIETGATNVVPDGTTITKTGNIISAVVTTLKSIQSATTLFEMGNEDDGGYITGETKYESGRTQTLGGICMNESNPQLYYKTYNDDAENTMASRILFELHTDGLYMSTVFSGYQWVKVPEASDLTALETELYQYIDQQIAGAASGFFKWKGYVDTYDDLPNNAETGDLYRTTDTGNEYYWLGGEWNQLDSNVDLSQYYTQDQTDTLLAEKVDKNGTDSLMTADEHQKLSNIQPGAQVNPALSEIIDNVSLILQSGVINQSPDFDFGSSDYKVKFGIFVIDPNAGLLSLNNLLWGEVESPYRDIENINFYDIRGAGYQYFPESAGQDPRYTIPYHTSFIAMLIEVGEEGTVVFSDFSRIREQYEKVPVQTLPATIAKAYNPNNTTVNVTTTVPYESTVTLALYDLITGNAITATQTGSAGNYVLTASSALPETGYGVTITNN